MTLPLRQDRLHPVSSQRVAGAIEQDSVAALALLEAVFEALPVGVSIHAEDGTCIFSNAAADEFARVAASPAEPGASSDADDTIVTETSVQALLLGNEPFALRTTADVTEQRRVERELFDRAFLDELTGLPNRALLQQSVEALIDQSGPETAFALAFIDLDHFKHINDYYSHAVGDALLVKIGARLSSMLRGTDLLARIGGDEFVLILTPVSDIENLAVDIQAIVERLKQPFFIDGHEIFASASIGISRFPEHGRSYEILGRNADSAMYRMKNGVKGGATMFDQTMGHAATARMELEQRLRLAIRDRRFCVAVQPKVEIRSSEVVGVEVLLRWRDEKGIIQAPGDFVGLAIELGLINEITHLVLDHTMQMIGEIDAAFGPGTSISLNVAAKQAEDVAFMGNFIEALAATGCPERFFLELTEEAFFIKSRFQTEVLPQLRRIGTRVSIDDFGVGYSSLAALGEIAADEIKIDRSFITDIHRRPRSQCVLRAIESLSLGLGMTIIAEGVESFEELAYLQSATRIQHAQGYYFARPMLLDELAGRAVSTQDRGVVANREVLSLRDGSTRPKRQMRN